MKFLSDLFRREPPITEADTQPVVVPVKQVQAPVEKPIFNTRGLDLEYLYNPTLRLGRVVYRGAFSAYLRQRGWRRISQKQYEVTQK